jgi:hypothetical protein
MTFHRGTHGIGGGGVEEFSTCAEEKVVDQSVMKELQAKSKQKELEMRLIRAAVDS